MSNIAITPQARETLTRLIAKAQGMARQDLATLLTKIGARADWHDEYATQLAAWLTLRDPEILTALVAPFESVLGIARTMRAKRALEQISALTPSALAA